MAVIDGNILLAAIPLSFFQMEMQKGWNAMDCAEAASKFSYEEIIDAGGEVQLLRKGQGAILPPCALIFQIGAGMLPDQCRPKDGTNGSAVFVALIQFGYH